MRPGAQAEGHPAEAARALLAWRGERYGGWQLQPNVPTVQGEVEAVLQQIMNCAREPVRAAGRLDAGVHAEAQLVTFLVHGRRTPGALYKGLNGLLPPDIACLALSSAPATFDPRGSSSGKIYRYRFLLREARCPFRDWGSWHVARPLDVDAMRAAAALLIGLHDFTSFQATGCAARHPVRRLRSLEVEDRGEEVHLVVDGEAFLRHQVRIIAGCLVEVGRGRRPPEWMGDLLAVRDRTQAARTAPAHGLTLEKVHFRPALTWEHGAPPRSRW